MTLKQEAFIDQLPKNGFNMAKTMREVGYSQQSSRSGTLYAALRKRLEKHFNPDKVKEDILRTKKTLEKNGDFSNYCRLIELEAKILGLTKEQSNTQVSVFTGDMIKDLPPVPVDNVEAPIDTKPLT